MVDPNVLGQGQTIEDMDLSLIFASVHIGACFSKGHDPNNMQI